MNTQLMMRDENGSYVPASDADIIAAAKWALQLQMQRGMACTNADIVGNYLTMELSKLEHEVFAVMFLDNKHNLLAFEILFRGTINAAAVYPREVVKAALKHNAAAVIFSHNHPSGNPEPSQADHQITARLQQALALVEVRVLDHIIVGGAKTYSFASMGDL